MMGMSSKEKAKVAGAVGGKTARACDGCLRRRARWYCAADDAFLCQACDTSVHSANPLARRHERLRLRVSSPPSPAKAEAEAEAEELAWYTRKARTPRGKHAGGASRRIVPESSDENKELEEHELLYHHHHHHHVPIFDPAVSAEFGSPPPPLEDSNSNSSKGDTELGGDFAAKLSVPVSSPSSQLINDSVMIGFSPSDAELSEFAADMEMLLGQNRDDSFDMESLGLAESPPVLEVDVKLESADNAGAVDNGATADMFESGEMSGEILDIDFDCGSPVTFEELGEEKIVVVNNMAACHVDGTPFLQSKKFVLRLDYEAVIASWGRSPWTDGERPQARLDECWPDYSGMWNMGSGRGGAGVGAHGTLDETGAVRSGMDGGREARVSRYREKRRTRLFSKKIRYEVRKLNAEKRPRMKGRFVKQGSSSHV